jgi:hypothetical protein
LSPAEQDNAYEAHSLVQDSSASSHVACPKVEVVVVVVALVIVVVVVVAVVVVAVVVVVVVAVVVVVVVVASLVVAVVASLVVAVVVGLGGAPKSEVNSLILAGMMVDDCEWGCSFAARRPTSCTLLPDPRWLF